MIIKLLINKLHFFIESYQLQRDALQTTGCGKIFEDQISGTKAERLGIQAALHFARPGDALVIWRLDRLSRSLKDLIEMVKHLESKGIGLKSLQESANTSFIIGKTTGLCPVVLFLLDIDFCSQFASSHQSCAARGYDLYLIA